METKVTNCPTCSEVGTCYNVGSDNNAQWECGACYASSVGHGGVPECRKAAVTAIEEVFGAMTPAMHAALSYYYSSPCKAGCNHEMRY